MVAGTVAVAAVEVTVLVTVAAALMEVSQVQAPSSCLCRIARRFLILDTFLNRLPTERPFGGLLLGKGGKSRPGSDDVEAGIVDNSNPDFEMQVIGVAATLYTVIVVLVN